MLKIYQQTGKMALGSRLRQFAELLGGEAAKVYGLYGVDVDPKWFPVLYLLRSGACLSISTIAEAIGHSHASVSKIVKEMTAAGITESEKVPEDGRINQVCLTDKGRQLVPKFQQQSDDVERVVEELLNQCRHNLWEAVSEMEYLLDEQDLYSRIKEKFIEREREKVQLVEFEPHYADAFRELNYEWIEANFDMEEADRVMLDAPQEYILDNGGRVLMALYEGEPVGTCALIKQDHDRFELAKMAVTERAKGKGIGYLLGRRALEVAKASGAQRVFLESNTKLAPAITLYKKLGFKRIIGEPSPYTRCNIQMEKQL